MAVLMKTVDALLKKLFGGHCHEATRRNAACDLIAVLIKAASCYDKEYGLIAVSMKTCRGSTKAHELMDIFIKAATHF